MLNGGGEDGQRGGKQGQFAVGERIHMSACEEVWRELQEEHTLTAHVGHTKSAGGALPQLHWWFDKSKRGQADTTWARDAHGRGSTSSGWATECVLPSNSAHRWQRSKSAQAASKQWSRVPTMKESQESHMAAWSEARKAEGRSADARLRAGAS